MDTKNNSNLNEEYIICEKCGEKNKLDSKFCIACGNKIENMQKENVSTPAFAPISEDSSKEVSEDKKADIRKPEKYIEPKNVFAEGLPSWSIEPPEVLVRRR